MPPLRKIFRPLLAFTAVSACLGVILYACGWILGSTQSPPAPKTGADSRKIAAIEAARHPQIDSEHGPTYWADVDYGKGREARWWPKGEPAFMTELVETGQLPPVEDRTGSEPLVVKGTDGIGSYGGTWLRAYTGDLGTVLRNYMGGGTLFRWSPQGYPIVPNVAKGWDHSNDFRVWTVYLRRGMKWSDGYPLTADDFVYHHEVYWPYLAPSGVVKELMYLGHSVHLVKIDDFTVQYQFHDPCPLFLERMTTTAFPCTPKHYYEQYIPGPGQTEEDLPRLQEGLKGTTLNSARFLIDLLLGFDNPEHPRLWPWVFRRFREAENYVLVRNPYFFAVDEAGNQLPYINQVVYQKQDSKMIPATAISGGMTFQFRHLYFSDYTLLTSNQETASNPYRVLHWFPAARTDFALFPNLNRQLNPLDPGSDGKAALLRDKHFRQALSLAIDRRTIIETCYQGMGEPAQISPGRYSPFAYPPLQNAFTAFDPEEANRKLDALGLTRRDAEGFRTLPDGSSLALYISYRSSSGHAPIPLIVDDWARVGIRAIARERAANLFTNEVKAGHQDFAVSFGSGEFLPLIDPTYFLPYSEGSYAFIRYGGWYGAGGLYGNPLAEGSEFYEAPPPDSPFRRAMQLYDAAQREIDPDKRIELTHQLFEINAEEVWSINLSTPPPIPVVVDQQLRNVPEVALQGYVFGSPNNAAKEAFYFATDHFANGQPRETPTALANLADQMIRVEGRPSLNGGSSSPAAAGADGRNRSVLLGKFLRVIFALVAFLGLLLVGLRHPFIGRRLLIMMPTLLIISMIVFTIIQAPPGDYIDTYIARLQAEGEASSIERIESIKEMFWLNDPMYMRYIRWMGFRWFLTFDAADTGLLQGNLGRSMETQRSVNDLVGDRILLTVLISAGTILFTWCFALPVGIYSAVRQYSIGDYFFTFVGFIGMCVPGFLLALLLSFFGRRFAGIEMTGLFSPEYLAAEWSFARVIDLMKHIWIPITVMGVTGTAGMIRVMRGNLLDELKKPYVTTARAKGVRPLRLLLKYPVRLALNPFISNIGGLFPQLISGGAIVAIVLSLPTVGPQLLQALLGEDMYFAGSMLMVLSVLGIFGMLVSDLLLLLLDPRIRMEGKN